jgi:hypothetical protein
MIEFSAWTETALSSIVANMKPNNIFQDMTHHTKTMHRHQGPQNRTKYDLKTKVAGMKVSQANQPLHKNNWASAAGAPPSRLVFFIPDTTTYVRILAGAATA